MLGSYQALNFNVQAANDAWVAGARGAGGTAKSDRAASRSKLGARSAGAGDGCGRGTSGAALQEQP